MRIWTYDVNDQLFSWRDENGRVAYTYTLEEFSKRYSQDDFIQLKDAIKRLVNQYKDARGHEEEEETLELKAKDMEDGDSEVRNFLVVVSVLRRDKEGKPTVIIGTKKDVTEARRLKRLEDERGPSPETPRRRAHPALLVDLLQSGCRHHPLRQTGRHPGYQSQGL